MSVWNISLEKIKQNMLINLKKIIKFIKVKVLFVYKTLTYKKIIISVKNFRYYHYDNNQVIFPL